MTVIKALTDVDRLFIDTAPIIYHVEGHPAYQSCTDVVFQQIRDGAVVAETSSITEPPRYNDSSSQ